MAGIAWSQTAAVLVSEHVRLNADRLARVKQDVVGERIPGQGRFRRSQRLRSPRDFERVRRRGRHISGALLSLTYARQEPRKGELETTADMPTRVGFSVSKRVGGAVERNRVKRRLRESVRRRLGALAPSWDIIITARSGAAQAQYAALDTALGDALTRARLWESNTSDSSPSCTV